MHLARALGGLSEQLLEEPASICGSGIAFQRNPPGRCARLSWRMKRSSISPIAVAVAAVAFLALLALVVAFGVRQTHQDEALPGTRVVGRDVAGRDAAQINRLLTPILSPARPLVLLAGARTLRLTPAQAGYSVSVAATARRAVAAGRGGILWACPPRSGAWSATAMSR